jgi:hypothetical protein
MTDALIDLVPTVILQAPSLAGMVFALVVLANHNRRLLSLLEKMCIKAGDCVDPDAQD